MVVNVAACVRAFAVEDPWGFLGKVKSVGSPMAGGRPDLPLFPPTASGLRYFKIAS
jgi:hypothetical protein